MYAFLLVAVILRYSMDFQRISSNTVCVHETVTVYDSADCVLIEHFVVASRTLLISQRSQESERLYSCCGEWDPRLETLLEAGHPTMAVVRLAIHYCLSGRGCGSPTTTRKPSGTLSEYLHRIRLASRAIGTKGGPVGMSPFFAGIADENPLARNLATRIRGPKIPAE